MKRQELVDLLKKIKPNEYVLEDHNGYDQLAKDMFGYIGDPDAELRDSLIYEGYELLLSNHRISKDTMRELWKNCQDEDHLLLEQGSKTGDSIFVRSFCTLLLVCLLETHMETAFLHEEEIHELLILFCDCYKKENVLFGYTSEKGWAHFAAHGADLLAALSKCDVVTKSELEKVLEAIQVKVCQGEYVYIDNEPWRMCQCISAILNRKVFEESELIMWLDTLKNPFEDVSSIEYYHTRVNIENFMRTMYFTVHKNGAYQGILDVIIRRVER